MGENPWQLRDPPPMADLGFEEKRALVLHSIARGNHWDKSSPFLHATRLLKTATWIFSERRQLYSHWLVRWPKYKDDEDCLDFEKPAVRKKWLAECDSDTNLLSSYLVKCRNYTEKDSELIYFRRPDLSDIDWWDEESRSWQNCLNSAKSQEWMRLLVIDMTQGRLSTPEQTLQWHSTTKASQWGKGEQCNPGEKGWPGGKPGEGEPIIRGNGGKGQPLGRGGDLMYRSSDACIERSMDGWIDWSIHR
jgi:hypothetical protein